MNSSETVPQHCNQPDGEHFQPPHFLVGRNRCGQWVVRDQRALWGGGLFNSRSEALRFAFPNNGPAGNCQSSVCGGA